MKVYIFRKKTDEASESLDLLLSQLGERGIEYKLIDCDASENSAKVAAYDITSTPSVVVAQDDGSTVEVWMHNIPAVDQVIYALGRV